MRLTENDAKHTMIVSGAIWYKMPYAHRNTRLVEAGAVVNGKHRQMLGVVDVLN